MKKKLIWMRNNVLLTFMFAVLVVSVIMLGFYFYKFNSGFSANNEDWGGFGSYFASITGLLAFAGVLYTAWQSEQRANKADLKAKETEEKAKEESIRREERDLFFKLLELHQEKLKSIVYFDKNKTIHYSLDALDSYANIINAISLDYAICFFIKKIGGSYFKEYHSCNNDVKAMYERIFANTHRDINNPDYKIYYSDIVKYIDANINNSTFYYMSNNVYNKNPIFQREYQQCINEIEIESIYNALKFIANIVNERYGQILSQYFKNMYYVLDTCNRFNYDKEYYIKLYRAQLSRNEILVCLLNAVSNKSSIKFVELLNNYKMLDDLYYEDLFFIDDEEKWKGKELDFVANIFNSYLVEHKESGSH